MEFEIRNNVLVEYLPEEGKKTVIVPDGVTEICYDKDGPLEGVLPVFEKCKDVESITLPASLQKLNPNDYYYLTNLKWIDCKGEVEIENDNCVFPGCKKIVYLVCNPNTPLSKMPSKWKQWLAIGFMKYASEGNQVDADALKEVKKYITAQNKKLELYKIGYEYPFVIKFMLDEKLLTEDLCEEMISYAQENKLVEVVALLVEGTNKQYPAEGAWERLEKRIETQTAHEAKMADHTSTEYLKTQWSWKKREDGTLIIWTYKGEETEVFVPAMVGKNRVTAVRGGAFQSRQAVRGNWLRCNLNKIHIAEGITSVGDTSPLADYAIATHVYLPMSVTNIGKFAFCEGRVGEYRPSRLVTIHAPSGSYAEQYAKENKLKFKIAK